MVFEVVRKIVAEQLGLDEKEVTLESDLSADLGADSLDAVEIVMALEDEYNMSIDDEAAKGIRTIKDLVEYVEKTVNK